MNAYEGPRAGKCDRWRDLILLDAEGTLPASDRDGLWQHLSGCAACRRYAGEVRAVLSVLSGEASPLPGGLERRLVDLAGGVLIKDNHLALSRNDIPGAIQAARSYAPHTLGVEIEVTDLAGVEAALAAGAEIILLDNMSLEEMRRAVEVVAGRALLEASGGITLETVGAVAETGVDLISCGAITHSTTALDISLEVRG